VHAPNTGNHRYPVAHHPGRSGQPNRQRDVSFAALLVMAFAFAHPGDLRDLWRCLVAAAYLTR
jgi:hypothetical protein